MGRPLPVRFISDIQWFFHSLKKEGLGLVYVSEDRGKFGLIVDMSIEQNISLPQLSDFAGKLGIIQTKKVQETGEKYMSQKH